MTQEEIKEGNKLIAEFMECYVESQEYAIVDRIAVGIEELQYDSSWDWLIPVVDKIYMTDEYSKEYKYLGLIGNNEIINTTFIETTFENAIEFIKWYNKQKEK